MRHRRVFSRDELCTQLRTLGVRDGDIVLVHTAFRAIRPVEDGPAGLIEALRLALGPGGTLVMPSWTGDDDNPFDPATTPTAEDLGATASIFWQLPGVLRSNHAHAFAAAGPHAEALLRDPLPLPPHIPESPVGRVVELDGKVLLLGVGHEANTTIHLGEVLAGVPYRTAHYCTILEAGGPKRIDYFENDCCGERFALADEWLSRDRLQRRGPVGNASARLVRAREVVEVVLRELREDPLISLHDRTARCEACDEARRSVADVLRHEPLR